MTPQNTTVTTPDLKALLDLYKTQTMIELNCHTVATVQSFDSSKQTVKATVAYQKTYFDEAGNPILVDYPGLVDCPLIVLGGGGGHLTFPVSPGDTGIMLFNDRDIDSWFSSGQVGPVPSLRLHSFSDGFMLIGVSPSPRAMTDYDTARSVLWGPGHQAMIAAGGLPLNLVKISNPTGSLKGVINGGLDLLDNLETALQAFASALTVEAAAGAALNAALIPLKAAIATYKTAVVGGLLE